ncbi:MlaD family protein [Undibacterium cyanobacteriorum]|uniref:MlaD family protein n=1 Tax=Undibacterium cyanobacteriorum TaxID=3073561 RepID=A0ABY9RLD8_9BURK|nr:MlaD family protein [Undibacterium sp. 20NA77.5]WMW81192.1 MlaD family protein [Undibacterium sp. 20NA77.5]
MESKSHALIAGVFSILLLSLAVVLGMWLGKDEIKKTPYVITTALKVSGLNVQAAVRYKGIKVGKVTDVDFDPKHPGQLIISLDIVSDTPITQSTYATLGYQGVTGIAYIELDDDGSKPIAVVADSPLGARIPLRPGLMQDIEKRGMAILAQTEQITERLNLLLDQKNRQSLTNTVEQIGKTAAAFEKLPAQLEPVINTLPQTVNRAQESLQAFKQFSENAKNTSTNLNRLIVGMQGENGSLERLTRSVEQLSTTMNTETLPTIQSLGTEARSSLRNINRLSEKLNDQPQSILFGNKATPPGPGEPGFNANSNK